MLVLLYNYIVYIRHERRSLYLRNLDIIRRRFNYLATTIRLYLAFPNPVVDDDLEGGNKGNNSGNDRDNISNNTT